MIVRRSLGFLLAAQLLLSTSAGAQAPAYNPAAWQEDLRVIARELPARHPDAFYRLTRARWDSAVAATGRRLPRLTRNQATVALMELVALVRDGHTSINPLFDPAVARRYYPLMLYDFEDGLYVRAAAPEYAALVGGKVLRIGKVDAAGYLAAARRVVPHENDGWLRAWGPDWLAFADPPPPLTGAAGSTCAAARRRPSGSGIRGCPTGWSTRRRSGPSTWRTARW